MGCSIVPGLLGTGGSSFAPDQWAGDAGSGWASAGIYHQDTRRVFGVDGTNRIPSGAGRAVADHGHRGRFREESGLRDGMVQVASEMPFDGVREWRRRVGRPPSRFGPTDRPILGYRDVGVEP